MTTFAKQQEFEWAADAILLGYRGSIAHGTVVPHGFDDVDYMGIVVPPLDTYFGLAHYGSSKGTVEIKQGEIDAVLYESRKAIGMLATCNPNILSILWLEPALYLKVTPAGQLLIDNRDLFLSKRIGVTFTGYAHQQLKLMYKAPTSGAYMGEKRKALVAKYGYDVKNASHLIRLLRMGSEILETGHVQVLRPDYQELVDIKTGGWEIQRVLEESTRGFERLEHALKISKLPDEVDMLKANQLAVQVAKLHLALVQLTRDTNGSTYIEWNIGNGKFL